MDYKLHCVYAYSKNFTAKYIIVNLFTTFILNYRCWMTRWSPSSSWRGSWISSWGVSARRPLAWRGTGCAPCRSGCGAWPEIGGAARESGGGVGLGNGRGGAGRENDGGGGTGNGGASERNGGRVHAASTRVQQ